MTDLCITPEQRKRIFAVLSMAILVTMAGVGIIAPYLPIYARDLGAGGTMIGFIFGGFSLARLVTMPIFGRWSDRKGRKRFIAVGFLFYALCSVLFILADRAAHLVAIRILQGASAAMIIPIAMAYVGEISQKDHEARSMNWINIAMFFGFGLGPLTGGFIHDQLGISLNFVALGIGSLVAFFIIMIFLPDIRVNQCGKEQSLSIGKSTRYREILKNRTMKGILAFRMSNALGTGTLMSFLPILAYEKLGLTSIRIGFLISMNLVVAGALQTLFSKIADQADRVRMAFYGNLLSMVCLAMMPFTVGFYSLLFVNLGMGVSGAIIIPAASGVVVSEGRKYTMGAVMALFNIAMSIGLASGPILSGIIKDCFNIYAVFIFAASAALLGNILLVAFLRKR